MTVNSREVCEYNILKSCRTFGINSSLRVSLPEALHTTSLSCVRWRLPSFRWLQYWPRLGDLMNLKVFEGSGAVFRGVLAYVGMYRVSNA